MTNNKIYYYINMKTKRHKLHNKRKKRTYRTSKSYKTYERYKLYGGDVLSTPNQPNNSIKQIMEQVKSQRKVNLGNNEILQKIQNLLKGFFIPLGYTIPINYIPKSGNIIWSSILIF